MRYSIQSGTDTNLRNKLFGGAIMFMGLCLVAVPVIARLEPNGGEPTPAVLSGQSSNDPQQSEANNGADSPQADGSSSSGATAATGNGDTRQPSQNTAGSNGSGGAVITSSNPVTSWASPSGSAPNTSGSTATPGRGSNSTPAPAPSAPNPQPAPVTNPPATGGGGGGNDNTSGGESGGDNCPCDVINGVVPEIELPGINVAPTTQPVFDTAGGLLQ